MGHPRRQFAMSLQYTRNTQRATWSILNNAIRQLLCACEQIHNVHTIAYYITQIRHVVKTMYECSCSAFTDLEV